MSNKDADVFNRIDTDVVGDTDEPGYVAPDQPMGSHAFGTTSAEERKGETFALRDRHTLPEVGDEALIEGDARVGQLLHGDNDVDATIDLEAEEVATDEGVVIDMSAEEQAMHITES